MTAIKYPIGRQDFGKLISDGCLYVDKTGYIHRLVSESKYVFLSRPRRFGKSLLLSTIDAFFKGRQELFKGLDIERLEPGEWKSYPVLHLDLSNSNYVDSASLENALSTFMSQYESEYGIKERNSDLGQRLEILIREIHRQTGRDVVILIDEYDNPITQVIGDSALQEELRRILHGFFSSLKTCDSVIRFCMLTGVTKYGKMSVFSGLNNLLDISFMDEYAGVCGITEAELHDNFHKGVEKLADKYNISMQAAYDRLKENYDGYHFSERLLDVYNPYSIVNALYASRIGSYWFGTGTPTMLVKLLRRLDIDVETLNGSEASMSQIGNISTFSVNPKALFYQTGYLTIKRYDEKYDSFILGFPNREVESGFMECLLDIYTQNGDAESLVRKMRRVLDEGNTEGFITLFQTYLADMPFDLRKKVGKYENYYHTIFYAVFSLLGVNVDAEYHTSRGSIDLVVKVKNYIYVIELKINGTASDAMNQIKEKGYTLPFEADGRNIVALGIGFSKATNTIESWEIENLS